MLLASVHIGSMDRSYRYELMRPGDWGRCVNRMRGHKEKQSHRRQVQANGKCLRFGRGHAYVDAIGKPARKWMIGNTGAQIGVKRGLLTCAIKSLPSTTISSASA